MLHRHSVLSRGLFAFILVFTLSSTVLHAQDSEPLRTIASFSILADVVQNVAGDAAQVESLIPAGVDPHSFSPSPQDVVGIAEADIVFLNGAGLEHSLLETLENTGGSANLVAVSDCVEIHPTDEHDHRDHEEAHDEEHEVETESIATSEASEATEIATQCATHHEALDGLKATEADKEADEHEHEHGLGMLYTLDCAAREEHEEHKQEEAEAEGEEHEQEHGACDPHVWTNPDNVILWVYRIRDALSAVDSANAEAYASNADAYIAQIVDLNENTLKPLLESVPEQQRVLITNHETMGYFAEAYGYRIADTVIPGDTTSSQLSAQDVVALIELIRAENIPAVFAENTVNASVAEQVASEGGAQFYTLLSDSLGTTAGTDSTYLEYLRYNAEVIAQALSGTSN
jgi:ABC-type Zn uptake system ZnuABC Zn-binding protein ZnuA